MALKRSVPSLDDVDEAFHSLYTKQSDGSYALEVEGEDPEVAEFRANNRKLNADIAKLQKDLKEKLDPYKDMSPDDVEKYKQLQEQLREKEEKDLLKEGKLQEIIDRRIAEVTKGHAGEVDTLRQTNQQLKGQLGTLQIDTAITNALESAGLKPRQGALADIMRRARDNWHVDDNGQPVPKDAAGNIRRGKTGDPLTFEEYVTADLAQSAAHLFEGAAGGGAGGGGKGGGPGGKIVVDRNDPVAMGKNMDKIISGEAIAQ